MAEIPGSLQTQTREPLDGKYWVQTFNDLNTGLTFQGILRFSKTQDKLYIKLTDGWVELATVGSATNEFGLTIGTVTAGTVASVTNVGTEIKPKLNFVLPLGRQGLAATINIERVEASPDGTARIQNVGTESDARLIFQLPKGVAGPKGDMFAINAQGTLANRAVYDGQAKDFVYLIDDSTSPDNGYIYLKTTTGWSNKIPFRGPQGATGNSTWIAYAQDATGLGATFIPAATTKYVSFLASVTQPVVGAFTVWQKYLGDAGTPGGPAGKSAYEIYVINGHPNATEAQFLLSLIGVNGTNGTSGASAYQTWLAVGNTGTEQQFIDSLKGSSSGYTLPTASTTVKGGIKLGTRLTVLNDVVSVDSQIQDSLVTSAVLAPNVDVVVAALNLKAPKDSPTFTGIVTIPFPELSLLDTNAASQGFVKRLQKQGAILLTSGTLTPYDTYDQAEVNAVAGSIIFITGYHTEIHIRKSITLIGSGTVGSIIVGYFAPLSLTVAVRYVTVLGRFVTCLPTTLGEAHTVIIERIGTGSETYFEQFGLGCPPTRCNIRIVDTRLSVKDKALFFQERDGQNSIYTLENCIFKSDTGILITGYPDQNVKIILEGSTKLIPASGKQLQKLIVVNTTVELTDAQVFIDNRPIVGGGSAYTLPPASTTKLGGVKIGANLAVSADGTVSAPTPGTSYTLPTASPTLLGGIKVGTKLSIVGDVLSADNQVDSTISTSTSLAPNSSSVSQALLTKADLVDGKVPIMQIPANRIMLKRTDGIFTYFSTYEEAINSANPGETLYFGPGAFGSSTVNVHLQKTISIVLDPNTTWNFQILYLQTYPNTGDRIYTIDGQGGGKLFGTIKFNDGSQTVALTLTNLRHEGQVEHTSYLAGFNNSPAKIKFDQVRSIAATGDYLNVGMRNGGFYYKPLYIESYNSFHSVTAGSFINNLGSDGGVNAGEDISLCRIYRSTIKCPSGRLLIVNADGAFVYDFSVVAYTGSLNAAIANGTTYSFIGTPTGGSGGGSNVGVIDYAAPVMVTATQTLQINKSHYVTGAGYTLTLPSAASNAGAALFISIAQNATGLYAVTGTTYVLYAGESLLLRETGGVWRKTGGELLPMAARIETSIAQQSALNVNAWNVIPFSVTARNTASPEFISGSTFIVQRSSRAVLDVSVVLKNCTLNGQYYTEIMSSLTGTVKAGYAVTANSSSSFGVATLSTTTPVTAGEVLTIRVFAGQTANLAGEFASNLCSFSFTELI